MTSSLNKWQSVLSLRRFRLESGDSKSDKSIVFCRLALQNV